VSRPRRIGVLVTDAVTPNLGRIPYGTPAASRTPGRALRSPPPRLGRSRSPVDGDLPNVSAADLDPRRRLTAPHRLAHNWNDSVLFRDRALSHAFGMATLAKKIEAERRMRELLESGGLPAPDRIEYGEDCIRLFFEETMTAVVIDLDDETESGQEP
jgi:hypothetical protein